VPSSVPSWCRPSPSSLMMAVCLFLNTGGFSQSVYWSDHSSSVQSTYRSGHISSVQSVSQAVQSVYRSGHGGSVQPTYQPGHISSVQSVQSVYWSGHSSSVHAVPPVCWSGHGSSFQFSWVGLLVRSRQSSRDRFSRGWRWFGECVSAFCWWQHLRPGPRTHKGRGGTLWVRRGQPGGGGMHTQPAHRDRNAPYIGLQSDPAPRSPTQTHKKHPRPT
jgi:hypothetical protein